MLNESFSNFIIGKDDQNRERFLDRVWDMLQRSYEKIGGIKGSGFSSKDDMLKNIPFWKLYISNGELMLVMFYKDKDGRKLVALGTDESAKSKVILTKVMKESFRNSYGEYSKHILAFILRNISHDLIKSYIIPPEVVTRVMKNETIIIPTSDDLLRLDKRDITLYKRYEKLRPYMYIREIGGEYFLKIMIGTLGKVIR